MTELDGSFPPPLLPGADAAPAVRETAGAHAMLRAQAARLVTFSATVLERAASPAQARALRRLTWAFADQTRHHHHGEDRFYWPLVQPSVPADQLSAWTHDHLELEALLEGLTNAADLLARNPSAPESARRLATAAKRLQTHLEAHLGIEEPLLLPALQGLTATQAEELRRNMVRSSPKRYVDISFGAIDEFVVESDRILFFRGFPPPLRPLFPLLRRRYQRTVTRAAGRR